MKEMSNQFSNSYYTTQQRNLYQDEKEATVFPENLPLAQAYIPLQPYETPKDGEQALVCGTVFENLVVPYCAGWHLEQYKEEF